MSGSKRKEKAPSKLEWMPMQELPSLPAAPPTQRRANMAVAISSHPAYETASVGAVFRQPSLQQMPSPSFAALQRSLTHAVHALEAAWEQEAQFPAVDTRRRTAEAYLLLSTNIRLCAQENIISARYVPSQTLSAPPYSGLGRSPKIATNLVSRVQGCQSPAHEHVAAVHTDEAASGSHLWQQRH